MKNFVVIMTERFGWCDSCIASYGTIDFLEGDYYGYALEHNIDKSIYSSSSNTIIQFWILVDISEHADPPKQEF